MASAETNGNSKEPDSRCREPGSHDLGSRQSGLVVGAVGRTGAKDGNQTQSQDSVKGVAETGIWGQAIGQSPYKPNQDHGVQKQAKGRSQVGVSVRVWGSGGGCRAGVGKEQGWRRVGIGHGEGRSELEQGSDEAGARTGNTLRQQEAS